MIRKTIRKIRSVLFGHVRVQWVLGSAGGSLSVPKNSTYGDVLREIRQSTSNNALHSLWSDPDGEEIDLNSKVKNDDCVSVNYPPARFQQD
jgi:hypothetical protein